MSSLHIVRSSTGGALIAVVVSASAALADITGPARVIDGDTLHVRGSGLPPQGYFRRQLNLKEGVARVLFAPRKLSFNGVRKRLPLLMVDGGRSNIVLEIDQEMRKNIDVSSQLNSSGRYNANHG